jgi:hypothetical protein
MQFTAGLIRTANMNALYDKLTPTQQLEFLQLLFTYTVAKPDSEVDALYDELKKVQGGF